MSTKLLAAAAMLLLAVPSASWADTTITITQNNAACKVPAPDPVTPPATPSSAGGSAALKNNNYALANANFRPLAEKGDVEAERLYGDFLMLKCTGLQDEAKGAEWLGKAADASDVTAQAELGRVYMNGEGVAQDDDKAFALLSKAAATGDMGAEVNLGYLYLSGRGVPKDLYQGMVWSVKAGEQGAPMALANIAHGYFKGDALPQDNDNAAYYMALAIERSTGAQRARVQASINNIARALSADDVQHASGRARRWSPGKGSLSDVLDDAAKMRAKMAKN